MQFEGRRRTSQVPNLTPLIDIVFLLLVFFMLTSHFIRDEALAIDLPEADSAALIEQQKPIEIIITSQGKIILDNHELTLKQLENTLRSRLSQQKDKVVQIRGDQQAQLGIAIDVFDAARNAGASGIDIITQPESRQQ
jgi:biopolymer transport protein ExbD